MRFFSKIVLICNACFLIVLFMHIFKSTRDADALFNGSLIFQPIVSTIAILGYIAAVILNLVFVFLLLLRSKAKRAGVIPLWMIIANVVILPVQLYFLFIMNS